MTKTPRELVCPVLTEKYGLTECSVTYTRPGKYNPGPERRFTGMLEDTGGAVHLKIVSADRERRIELAQDIIRASGKNRSPPPIEEFFPGGIPQLFLKIFTKKRYSVFYGLIFLRPGLYYK